MIAQAGPGPAPHGHARPRAAPRGVCSGMDRTHGQASDSPASPVHLQLRTPADVSPHDIPARYLTEGTPGIGGQLRRHPEDFIVEELPAYTPCGQGEHIYLYLQKVNMSTGHLVELVARHFSVPEEAVGYAGLKDKRAVTRQVISVHTPGKGIDDFGPLTHDRVQVLWADTHTNKLRRGHLRGNRFAIKVRSVPLSAVITAKRTLDALARSGVPNRAGEQRFGFFHNNHLLGRLLILGDWPGVIEELLRPRPAEDYPDGQTDPGQVEARELFRRGLLAQAARAMPAYAQTEAAVLAALARGQSPSRAIAAIGHRQRGFYVSAWQSAVFNAVLDRRLIDGTLGSLLRGDVAVKHDNGATFDVTEATAADPETRRRADQLAVSPTGPMWGHAMRRAAAGADEAELAALAASGLSPEALAACAQRSRSEAPPGDRRPLRVPLSYPEVEAGSDEHGLFVRCSFELPAGSFATVVMGEVMKPDRPTPMLSPAHTHTPAATPTPTPESPA
ncbi:MAG: tRNA pseudouridine(13) synthase TruD [Planctomyces sp.]|nr:tRNA pseudouridine(13) synthase TruD [Planctomyces sp.]